MNLTDVEPKENRSISYNNIPPSIGVSTHLDTLPASPQTNLKTNYYKVYEEENSTLFRSLGYYKDIEEDNLDSHKRIKTLVLSLYRERPDFDDYITPRTYELIEDIEDDQDTEQKIISFESFNNFTDFLTKNDNLIIPSFIVTYEGNIRALWRKSRIQHLAVEFNPDDTNTYVIFTPNPNNTGKVMRSTGTIDKERLYQVVVSMGADEWICR